MTHLDGLIERYAHQQGTLQNAALCAILDMIDSFAVSADDDAEIERIFNDNLQTLRDCT